MQTLHYDSTQQRRLGRILPDLIRGRELLADLVRKDLRVRYRYAVIGFLWAVLEPLALMLVLTLVFTFLFDIDEVRGGGVQGENSHPYAVVLLCGLIFWQFTATALGRATQSLIENENLVKKVFFAREIIPLAAITYPLINLGIGFLLLLAVHLMLGGGIGLAVLWFLPVFLIQLTLTTGLGLLFSCGNVAFRDVGYIVSVAVTFGFYASPVFYDLGLVINNPDVPQWAENLYLCNPMAGLLTAYRQILLEQRCPDLQYLALPALLAAAALASGAIVFRRAAPTLSDRL